jgi:hypothetical protein
MRTRTFIAAAALVAFLGYLGFRIFDLESRVANLTRQLGAAPEPSAQPSTPDKPASAAVAPQGYLQRLAALEQQVAALKLSRQRPDKGSNSGGSLDDQAILSVVERENNRVKDVQLEWNRARWMENRDEQLATFTKTYGLTPEQTANLQKAMHEEVDTMVELLRRPGLLDDPDQAATDWQNMLEVTDKAARKFLNPAQLGAWNLGRTFERRFLYPWLPSNLNK